MLLDSVGLGNLVLIAERDLAVMFEITLFWAVRGAAAVLGGAVLRLTSQARSQAAPPRLQRERLPGQTAPGTVASGEVA